MRNNTWPSPPAIGWWLPPDWLTKVNDIIRTTITVKYLDGITYLVDAISEHAQLHNGAIHHTMQATEEGYYAAHLYYRKTIEIPKRNFDTEERKFNFEIQISTQIKELIKLLLHRYYFAVGNQDQDACRKSC